MPVRKIMWILLTTSITTSIFTMSAHSADQVVESSQLQTASVQLGPRPYHLIEDMEDSRLKDELQQCANGPFYKTDFSIGHRGASMQFPEHTKESYIAAARMGAGILECDVTFTKDKALVCRHSQCDLHTTTNILARPELAAKCSVPFSPAEYDREGKLVKKASAQCCASDLTLEEFKSLEGKMDAFNPAGRNVAEYMDGTAGWRTDLYSSKGTLMTHAESIELFKQLKVKMTPELKSPSVDMPYDGNYTQQKYAQQLINEYKKAGVPAEDVYPQSFNLNDVVYWLEKEPRFGKQGVYLDDRYSLKGFDPNRPDTWELTMEDLFKQGVRIVAPPIWMLVTEKNDQIVPSAYAKEAKAAGLEIITWTLERSGPLSAGGGWYYQSIKDITNNDGDMMVLLDVLAQQVGVIGVFSDWPATVTYYANCKQL